MGNQVRPLGSTDSTDSRHSPYRLPDRYLGMLQDLRDHFGCNKLVAGAIGRDPGSVSRYLNQVHGARPSTLDRIEQAHRRWVGKDVDVGATTAEKESLELLKAMGVRPNGTSNLARQITLPSGQKLKLPRSGSTRGAARAWINVRAKLRRLMQQDTTEPQPQEENVTNGKDSIDRTALRALGVETKTKLRRVILEEEEHVIELNPYQLHSLLSRAGLDLGSEAKFSWTNEGKLRVRWSETKESLEGDD